MPQLNQNFTRLEHDTFVLQYIAVDGVLNDITTQYAAWWGLSDNATSAPTIGLALQGWSNNSNPHQINNWNVLTTPTAGCSDAATPLGTSPPFNVQVSATTVTIQFTQTIFEPLEEGEYYHELVLIRADTSNTGGGEGTAYQCRSHVAATGILTVKESLFTNRPYR